MTQVTLTEAARGKSAVEGIIKRLFLAFFALPLVCLAVVALAILASNAEVISPRLEGLISGAAGVVAVVSGAAIAIGSLVVAWFEARRPTSPPLC